MHIQKANIRLLISLAYFTLGVSSIVWAEEPNQPVKEEASSQVAKANEVDLQKLAEKVAQETTDDVEEEETPEAKVEATPETKVEATPETKVEATPEAKVEATPEAKVEATPEAKSVLKPIRKVIKRTNRSQLKGRKNKRKKNQRRLRKFPTNRPQRELKAPPQLGQIPFPLGETLTFKVNMLNAHSGTVTLKVGRRGQLKGQSVLELSGFVQSSPALENFYPIRDSLRVLIDERTFLPVKSEFFLNEKNRKVDYISEFNQKTGQLDWTKSREVKGRKKTSKLSYIAPLSMHQTLSSLYALRRLDLKPGLSFEQYIWDGQRERLIEVNVVGEERVLTGMGWIEAYKLSIQGAITGGIISKRLLKQAPVKGFAWIAKDAYRTPIKAITPTKLGQAEAILSEKSISSGE